MQITKLFGRPVVGAEQNSTTRIAVVVLSLVVLAGCAVLAQAPSGFTASSAVSQYDAETFYLGAEANLFPQQAGGVAKSDIAFSLPPGRRITALEASVSSQAGCAAMTLGFVEVDGRRIAVIQKIYPSGQVNEFVRYSIPVAYTSGQARLHVEATGCDSNWEIQGLLRVQP